MYNMDFLRTISLFQGMGDEELEEVLAQISAGQRSYLQGDYIFREGDPLLYAGIVLEGYVQVVREDYYGNRDILGHMAAHGLFGEALCFCGAEQMPVSIVAGEDCTVLLLRLKGTELSARLQQNLLSEISTKVLTLTNKLRIVQHKKTADKLMSYLRDEAKKAGAGEFDIPYSRQELADYLGVERSAMIVELRKLKDQGWFDVHGRHFRLLK